MIRINLLPFRSARKKENIRRQLSISILTVGLALVAILGVYLFLDSRVSDLNDRIKVTQAELEKYDKINKEIAEIKKKLDTLNKKLDVIRALEASRYEPVLLLDILTQAVIEKRMWFTKLDSNVTSLTITGMAMDDKTVADFMLRLEGTGLFSTVSLRNVKQVELQKTPLKSFEIISTKKQVNPGEAPASAPLKAKK
ncbi:MAG: PilN domain-containing protein [Desulfobacterales bacterium]|jgi:type IV pilus assembly protein PilN|nr:PilN domain-containing protein [Desulfobacterales bacterium]